MRIGDCERETGLSRKTIRFYEAKGLLSVDRNDNSYRDYDESDIVRLKQISVLRGAGIGLNDIQLWINSVISYDEMVKKRLYELKDAADTAKEQVNLCTSLLENGLDTTVNNRFSDIVQENGDPAPDNDCDDEYAVGIDLGTTTISTVVVSVRTGKEAAVYTINSNAGIKSDKSWEKTQDADMILDRVNKILVFICRRYEKIRSIGFSGQMHGIVYIDRDCRAVSPLYTWQDERGGLGEYSVCRMVFDRTGYRISSGYGFATHLYNVQNGLVPEDAVMMCTIMDYCAASVCGLKHPVTHSSNAASLGLYDLSQNRFDSEALGKLGIDDAFLPEVYDCCKIIGQYNSIPVSVPVGDNQAGFMGAVRNPSVSVLANYGTGSQISMLLEKGKNFDTNGSQSVEIRPFNDGWKLICGSALCGGRAYAMLEKFFRSYLTECSISCPEQYEIINRLALEGLESGYLDVSTAFCGKRDRPDELGYIRDISEHSFTPQALCAGFVMGMADELYEMYAMMPKDSISCLVVSGNGARKNPALRKALEMKFSLSPSLPDCTEEAAYGAAKFSAVSAGLLPSLG